METKTLRIKPFYIVANRMLRQKINTIDDVKKFYIGINELASQISLNEFLINELSSVEYSDNQKLIKGITSVLGYGQVVGEFRDLFTAKEIKLYAFLKKNPRFKNGIGIIQKEATIYFNTLAKRVEELEKKDKEKDKTIEELKREIKDAIKSNIFSPEHIFKVEFVGTVGGLSSGEKVSPPKEIHISYNTNLGKFTFNGINDVLLEGKQKDVADCLVGYGKERKTSWDELFDCIGDTTGDSDRDTKIRVVRTAVVEINKHSEKYLPPGKKFIATKNNEYWLQYEIENEVDKSR